MGEFVFKRTYSRIMPTTGENETWSDCVERVVNGC
jgi:hypothetical protein